MPRYLSLSSSNKAQVKCPIFNTTVNVASCMKLRDKVWRGEEVDVRKGCQACMRCSKCPAAELVRKISYSHGNYPDNLGSNEPKVMKFSDDILSRIEKTIVVDNVMDRMGVPDAERQLIATSSKRITEAMKSAPNREENKTTVIRAARSSSQPRQPRQKKEPSTNTKLKNAALTGDLSAALQD